jgi:Ni2+-binding GTPase involved in maturation of urease and hydrogenase
MSPRRSTIAARRQAELRSALHTLRLLVREVGGNYLAGLQSEVARIEVLVRDYRQDDTPDAKQLRQMADMLQRINRLDIKPQKGRRRDVKQLDKLIERLTDTVDQW